jgi:hypothetical protein
MKDVAGHGGDVSRFVPPAVQEFLARRFPAYARVRDDQGDIAGSVSNY